MTPGARIQAAIDLVDRIVSTRQPADQLIKAWGAANRYAGSKDRKAVAERVYLALRQPPAARGGARARILASLALQDGLSADQIAALFTGEGHAPAPLTRAEREALAQPAQAVLPAFLQAQLEATFGQDAAIETQALLSTRALLDIRINTLRADIDHIQQVLTEAGVVAAKTPLSALGLRLEGAPDLAPLNTFKAGAFEVQDEGSQLCALIAGSERPALVIDYCAGGGGKTLALACTQSEQDEGKRIIACDINGERLKSIGPRLARAGVTAELRKLGLKGEGVYDLQGQADLVLVDAPCSGSGVWRRRPEQAWRLTQAGVDHFAKTQGAVLQHASKLVKPGGRLAYVTCSVLHAENGAVADAFLAKHANTYRPIGIAGALNADWITAEGRARLAALAEGGHTLQLSPGRTGTDGFFIALFERIS